MDVISSNSSMIAVSPDKVLQSELSTLSKQLPSYMVQQISDCLNQSRALTDYEVQVIRAGATDRTQAVCLLQTLLHKGQKSCLLFFQCLNACNPSLFETITRGLVKVTDKAHHHVEKTPLSEATGSVPPYVININNSSLTNCIIGKNNSLYVSNDTVEQMQRSQHTETPDSTEVPNIQVESSNVEYVIIGDNNYMNVESSLDSECQEESDSVPEDSEG